MATGLFLFVFPLVACVHCRDLREVFKERRCLPKENVPVYPFDGRRSVIEVNPWSSHQLVSTVAAIILREEVGYDVDLNLVNAPRGVFRRVAKEWSETGQNGATADELLADGEPFGYVNMEVWQAGVQEDYREFVNERDLVDDVGFLGYTGRSGWFISKAFAERPEFAGLPEFYRAYDGSTSTSQSVLEALRQHATVDCTGQSCCCTSASSCTANLPHEELVWCPEVQASQLPAVLAVSPYVDEGFNEEIARSNFGFAIRYVGMMNISAMAMQAFSNGDPLIVHMWRPSSFLTRLRMLPQPAAALRILMHSEGCGEHFTDGSGNWSCDFPEHALSILTSTDIRADPVAHFFFSRFTVAENGDAVPHGSLTGAGINELMEYLVREGNFSGVPTPDDIFNTACDWVQANQGEGNDWTAWVKPRKVPFFADTLTDSYPLPAFALLLLLCCLYVLFLENPWLWTTLSPVSVEKILAKSSGDNPWRTKLELKLKSNSRADAYVPSSEGTETAVTMLGAQEEELAWELPKDYRCGLADLSKERESSRAFWEFADKWEATARKARDVPAEAWPAVENLVHFDDHTFPCFQDCGTTDIILRRRASFEGAGKDLVVKVVVEESDGGAKAGKDFEGGEREVHFPAGKDFAILSVPIVHHEDVWANTYWFQVRITSLPEDAGFVTAPATATILVLDTDRWPANLPNNLRSGHGVSLMRYFIKMEKQRRGEKWWKTMIAMLTLPVHSVLVSTLVQKLLVDHVTKRITSAEPGEDVLFNYWTVVGLVMVQFLSLGFNRWADVVQTRNRGRTGGIRQVHRGELLRKFLHLEHSEHWEASDAHWLYSAIYDADVITGQAYFQVFVFAQSCFALVLSVMIVVGLVIWSFAIKESMVGAADVAAQMLWFVAGIFIVVPLGLYGVWKRRKLTWVAVIARRAGESDWFKSCNWIFSNWRSFYGFVGEERLALEKQIMKQNTKFVSSHWDARDTMNDTSWVTHWVQGIAYCFILMFGTFSLIESSVYGLGAMEVGTFYALCKIYLVVGKYVGRLSSVFVQMQRAVVSIRELSALLNMRDQSSFRREALLLPRSDVAKPKPETYIFFDQGVCHLRPDECKVGSTFAELMLRETCRVPMGRLVHVSARNERVLRTFLGLCSKVIHPTTSKRQPIAENGPKIHLPPGLRFLLLPMVPSVGMATKASSVLELLHGSSKVPEELCEALAHSLGLEPDRNVASLGPGSSQVFSIARALLMDPDVLCVCRPLALVPPDVRRQVALMLRVWQGAGGLPKLAEQHGITLGDNGVYRRPSRTLILGNAQEEMLGAFRTDVHINLDEHLWVPHEKSL